MTIVCSRYNLTSPPQAVRAVFGYDTTGTVADFPPRYNIAPTQPVAIVRSGHAGQDGRDRRELALVRWGLLPPWVKDPREFATLINARSETAADKPSFRGALRHRRCLVPADGFYEWTGKPGSKRPHLVRPRGGGPFGMAGLWEHWVGADGSELETMAILTTAANATMAPIHDRMPVILSPDDFAVWLDCRPGTAEHIVDLLRPAPDGVLEVLEIDRAINNSRVEGPELLNPVRLL